MKLHTGITDTYVQPAEVTAESAIGYIASLAEIARKNIQHARNGTSERLFPELHGDSPVTEAEALESLRAAVKAIEENLAALKSVL